MARMESISLSVNTWDEQNTINKLQKFGWSLVSSQEIFSQDSHIEGSCGYATSVTNTTNYVKLVFNRDKDMPYYNEICSCESRYNDLMKREPCKELEKFNGVTVWVPFSLLEFVFMLILILNEHIVAKIISLIVAIALIPVASSLANKANAINKQNEITYQAKHKKWEKDVAIVLSEIEAYV